MKKYLVVFICHIINDETIKRYNAIKNGLPEGYDIIFCSPTPSKNTYNLKNFLCLNLTDCFWKYFNDFIRNELCYIGVYDKYPNYNNYYFIEYDVMFNKTNTSDKWNEFFNKYNHMDIDLLCSHYNKYNIKYHKSMWKYNFLNTVEKNNVNTFILYFCFLPICMISNRLMKDIKDYYNNDDNNSFFEYLIPSMATYKKYNIYCLDNDYVQLDKNIINKPHYNINNGSMSWYNEDKSIYDDNILIHPIKLNLIKK